MLKGYLKKFKAFGILTIYNESTNVLYENKDEEFVNCTLTTELTKYIKCELTKTFYFAKLTEAIIEFIGEGNSITKQICLWCDENKIDIIFITGYTYDLPYEYAVKQMNKIIKKIINKQVFEKYETIVSKIKNCDFAKKLEFDPFICGTRNETLIINLYGFRKITYVDTIITILEQNNKIELTFNLKEDDTNKASEASSFDKRKELNVAKQDIIDMESSSENYFSSSEVMNEIELEDVISKDIQYPMIPVEKALSIIQKVARYGANEKQYDSVKLNDAYGRTLYETVYSDCNVPAFRVSAKHGYAVLASDVQGIRTEILGKTISEPVSLKPGTCVWVKSGARVPDEATAVVQVEDVKRIVNTTKIMVQIKPELGQNIKNIGSEIQKEQLIIHPFTRIGPVELGLLATIGRKKVVVAARISVGVLSIGDLLEEPENPLTPGYVYDSNRISIIALLKDKGFDLIEDFGIVADNTLLIKSKIKEALTKVDVLVTIGCSNDIDQLKMILFHYFNASIHFGNVNIKPEKSTIFATYKFGGKRKYFLCLSRNPESVLISAHLFLLPLLNGLGRISDNSHSSVPTCINQ